jgi:putative hydrolase of the HAD superfamily
VIFDLDDTLYPERQYVLSGYRAVCRHLAEHFGGQERFERFLWNRFRRGSAAGAFDALSAAFKLGLDERNIAHLVGVYRQHMPDITAFAGMPDLLSLLRSRFRLGLLTDGFMPAQRLKLEALQLERFFDAVVFTEEIGREAWKPSPEGFERIREMLDRPHAACAYVADNLAKDFIAPNALGWLTVRYVQPGQIQRLPAAAAAALPACTVSLPGEVYETLVQWAP